MTSPPIPASSMQRTAFPHAVAGIACAALIVASIALAYWPGIHGFWGRDDYFQLAMARLLGSPWPLFIHDHFPVPGSVFRPLGFASMWLGTRLFGTEYAAHALGDLGLHAAVALALYGLLRRATVPRAVATSCTLLFALHPAALGSALWWSARFDLLATLFVLLALQAAFAYREHAGGGAHVALALLAALAAMLSKEIGLVAVAAMTIAWAHWAWREPTQRKRALRAIAFAWALAAFYLGWRALVLGTASSGLTGAMPLAGAVAKGVADWIRQAPGYLVFWSRLGVLSRVVLAGAVLLALAAVARMRRPAQPRPAQAPLVELALGGACLLLLPALLQAPVAALNAAPLGTQASAIDAAMQSRLYYLGIAGLALVIGAACTRAWDACAPGARALLVLALGLGAATFGWAARESAREFATRSLAISAVARDVVAAIARVPLPATRCGVVVLGVEPPPEWSRYVSIDSMVKALSPDLDRVAHCWFHADYPTYFQLMRAPVDAADAAPYQALAIDGRRVPWRRLGNLEIAYLEPLRPANTVAPAALIRLRYRDGHFAEFGAEPGAAHSQVESR